MTTIRVATPAVPRAARPQPGAGASPAGPAGVRPAPAGPPARTRLTGVDDLAASFVRLFLEVEAGRRPRPQLRPFLTPMLYARLSQVWITSGPVGQVQAVRIVARRPAGADIVAVVRRGSRWGGIGLRLTRARGRWLVDEIARPEDGGLPAPPYPVPSEEPEEAEDELPVVLTAASGAPEPDWLHPG